MTRTGRMAAQAMAMGTLALALVAGAASAQRGPAPRQAKAERNQVIAELGKLQQAQMALFRRYATDDAFAGQLDDLMAKRDFRGAAAAAAGAAGLPVHNVQVSDAASVGADGAAALGVEPGVVASWDAISLRQLRGPNASLVGAAAMATSGHVCFNIVIVKGCIDW